MKEQKIIIAGNKYFTDKAFVYRTLDKYLDFLFEPGKNPMILNGGSGGVDYLARQYANENSVGCKTLYANWNEYGNKAGFIRNNEMATEGEILIAFHNGDKYTSSMIVTAIKKGLEVHVVTIPKTNTRKKYKTQKKGVN